MVASFSFAFFIQNTTTQLNHLVRKQGRGHHMVIPPEYQQETGMHYFYDTFEEYTWQYIADTHSDSVKTEVIADLSLAKEFRIHIPRFQPGAGAEPHSPEWSHAMYIMNGTGRAVIEEEEAVVTKGMLAFAPSCGTLHL